MPSKSTYFNQILNKASSEHKQTIQNLNKDTSPSQEHPQSSSTPAKTPETSSIFERVLDAFKLIRFQPNFKHSFFRAFADHPKRHQGHQPQQGESKYHFVKIEFTLQVFPNTSTYMRLCAKFQTLELSPSDCSRNPLSIQ